MVNVYMKVLGVNIYLASELAPEVVENYCPFATEETLRKVTDWALAHHFVVSSQNDSVFSAVELAQSVDRDMVMLVDIG